MPLPRRKFIRNSATLAAAWGLLPHLRAAQAGGPLPAHPRIFIAANNDNGLQSVADFRRAVETDGFLGEAWATLIAQAETEAPLPPLQVDDMVPGRPAVMARDRNPDYFICYHAGARLCRFALAHLVTGEAAYLAAAKAQLNALFNDWPDWIDQAHISMGYPADLRTGMLSQDCAIAYDWLYDALTETERAEIREGIIRRGITPFLDSLELDPWWMKELNNWITVIAGGVATAAMALYEHHPKAQFIIDTAAERFEAYLAIYGPDGEFNESVAYGGANRLPVNFFNARRFATGGSVDRLPEWPFPETCRWMMHGTLDNKKMISFGDSWPERDVMSGYVAAVAAAAQDPVLQHYFLRTRSDERDHPLNLLAYDARLKPLSPAGREPLAIAYPAYGGMIVSRTSWDPPLTDCILFGKSGREENHEHNDVGVIGFDTLGERLIVDLGSPSGYPADFFDDATRWKYYNASVKGHNTITFGGREQLSPRKEPGQPILTEPISGRVEQWWHEPGQGTAWTMELAPAYSGVKHFKRTVLHLWPGYILVLDDAEVEQRESISLRWHTINQAEAADDGSFVAHNDQAAATGRIINLGDGDLNIQRKEHRYEAPYDRERTGDLLEVRNESFLNATLIGDHCRLLTLFATGAAADFGAGTTWQTTADGWVFDGPHGPVTARVDGTRVSLTAPQLDREVSLELA
jgi:hypothetical protein